MAPSRSRSRPVRMPPAVAASAPVRLTAASRTKTPRKGSGCGRGAAAVASCLDSAGGLNFESSFSARRGGGSRESCGGVDHVELHVSCCVRVGDPHFERRELRNRCDLRPEKTPPRGQASRGGGATRKGAGREGLDRRARRRTAARAARRVLSAGRRRPAVPRAPGRHPRAALRARVGEAGGALVPVLWPRRVEVVGGIRVNRSGVEPLAPEGGHAHLLVRFVELQR